jgi:hypothetical protein
MHKIIGKYKIYFQPLHMLRQIDYHLKDVCIRDYSYILLYFLIHYILEDHIHSRSTTTLVRKVNN